MAVPSAITLTPSSGVAPFPVKITGTDLFERPVNSGYLRKETFTVASPNALPAGWLGTAPTRTDGIIGKAIKCNPTGGHYLNAGTLNTDGSIINGNGNYLWPGPLTYTRTLTSYFISLWIKPNLVTNCGLIQISHGYNNYTNDISTPYNANYSCNIGVYLKADGGVGIFQKGASTSGATTVYVKNVYAPAGTIVANQWHHILCQWSSAISPWVSIDAPVIWVNGVKKTTTIVSNANMVAGIDAYYSAGDGLTNIGRGYCCSVDTPTVINGAYAVASPPSAGSEWSTVAIFNGDICDVYTGNTVLSDAQILMYANLPKVELIKV